MALITDSIGRVLGKRYRLLSAVGAGASAQVFLAEDVSLRRYVAVKVLQPGLAKDDAFLKRFRAEARFVASLNHPNVLRVFDWGEDSDGPFLVLEYLGGGSLLDLLQKGSRLTPAQAALMGSHAAQGLAYAHSRGLVHRDVKPANLLFDEEGRVRVADFGVARALAEAAWTEPGGAMVGTVRYASPEQAGGQALDGRADVYALGLVLFEAVTGVVPFTTDTTMGTLMARVGKSLPLNSALGPLQDALGWACNPDPVSRPQASALATQLESIATSLPTPPPLPIDLHSPTLSASTVVINGSASPAAPPTTVIEGVVPGVGTTMVPPISTRGPVQSHPGQIFDVEEIEPPRKRQAQGTKHRRTWVLLVILAALVIAAGLLISFKEKVFTASGPVPALSGLTLASANQALSKDHFGINNSGLAYSKTVAAGHIIKQSPSAGTSLKQGQAVSVVVSKGPPPVSVPSLIGLDCTGVSRILGIEHLKAACPAVAAYSATVPSGNVINWSFDNKLDPTSAPYGSTVLVAISKGPTPISVPNVVGDTAQQAQSALQADGFVVTQSSQSSSTYPSGEVVSTDPPVGSQLQKGSGVTIYVSTGPATVVVPQLRGDSLSRASSILEGMGFVVGPVYGPSNADVLTTTPDAGNTEPVGTSITIYLGSGG